MRFGFIGTGNMGTALMSGYVAVHRDEKDNLFAFDTDQDKLLGFTKTIGIHGCKTVSDLMESCDVIVLAIKPQIFDAVLPEIGKQYRPEQIVVSIAAGISMNYIETLLGNQNAKVIRVMPNTPAMVNAGMSALCRNEKVSDEEFGSVLELFRAVGKAEVIEEKMMDVIIGISGSSPAYTYMYIEALMNAAMAGGMDREQATIFAGQAVLGAAKMVLETGSDPVTLRNNVCSPGGTTIEAVESLKSDGFQEIVERAFVAAVKKSEKLTK